MKRLAPLLALTIVLVLHAAPAAAAVAEQQLDIPLIATMAMATSITAAVMCRHG